MIELNYEYKYAIHHAIILEQHLINKACFKTVSEK